MVESIKVVFQRSTQTSASSDVALANEIFFMAGGMRQGTMLGVEDDHHGGSIRHPGRVTNVSKSMRRARMGERRWRLISTHLDWPWISGRYCQLNSDARSMPI